MCCDVVLKHSGKVAELLKIIEHARKEIGDYMQIGSGAQFFDEKFKRPESFKWQEKEENGWKQETEFHPYYNDGGRKN